MSLPCNCFITSGAEYVCGFVSHKFSLSQIMYVSPLLFYNRLRTGFLLLSAIFQRTGDVLVLRCCSIVKAYQLFATPWTVAHQAALSMGFPKQEYLSELPFPPPRNLPEPGIEPMFPVFAGGFFTTALPVQSLFLTFCLFLFSNFPSYSIISHRPASNRKSNDEFIVFMAVQQVMVCLYY